MKFGFKKLKQEEKKQSVTQNYEELYKKVLEEYDQNPTPEKLKECLDIHEKMVNQSKQENQQFATEVIQELKEEKPKPRIVDEEAKAIEEMLKSPTPPTNVEEPKAEEWPTLLPVEEKIEKVPIEVIEEKPEEIQDSQTKEKFTEFIKETFNEIKKENKSPIINIPEPTVKDLHTSGPSPLEASENFKKALEKEQQELKTLETEIKKKRFSLFSKDKKKPKIKGKEEITREALEKQHLLKLPKPKRKNPFKKSPIQKMLKNVECYCNICKHKIQDHYYKGESAGCKCGCLSTITDILKANEISIQIEGEAVIEVDTGQVCTCGHREITHTDKTKFCEEKNCYCMKFTLQEDGVLK